jgi:hypothetical protein
MDPDADDDIFFFPWLHCLPPAPVRLVVHPSKQAAARGQPTINAPARPSATVHQPKFRCLLCAERWNKQRLEQCLESLFLMVSSLICKLCMSPERRMICSYTGHEMAVLVTESGRTTRRREPISRVHVDPRLYRTLLDIPVDGLGSYAPEHNKNGSFKEHTEARLNTLNVSTSTPARLHSTPQMAAGGRTQSPVW